MPDGQDNHPPPPLSDAYRKTRRWYTFFSALLLTYALIGFDLVEKIRVSPTGPNEVGDHSLFVPIQALGDVGIKFQNLNAFPWVLGLLLIFFAYRTHNEWLMCPGKKTKSQPAKVDHHVSQALGGVALTVPMLQFVLNIRVAEYLPKAYRILLIVGLAFVSGANFKEVWKAWNARAGQAFRQRLSCQWLDLLVSLFCLFISFLITFLAYGFFHIMMLIPLFFFSIGFVGTPLARRLVNRLFLKPHH